MIDNSGRLFTPEVVQDRRHFTWSSYLDLLRKAQRDLDRLMQTTPDTNPEYGGDVFNLVCTANHIWDWVKHCPNPGPAAAKDMLAREKNNGEPFNSVQVVFELCSGLKHLELREGKTPPTTRVRRFPGRSGSRVGGDARVGGSKNPFRVGGIGPRTVFEVDVAGRPEPVADVVARALEAWTLLLADHGLPTG